MEEMKMNDKDAKYKEVCMTQEEVIDSIERIGSMTLQEVEEALPDTYRDATSLWILSMKEDCLPYTSWSYGRLQANLTWMLEQYEALTGQSYDLKQVDVNIMLNTAIRAANGTKKWLERLGANHLERKQKVQTRLTTLLDRYKELYDEPHVLDTRKVEPEKPEDGDLGGVVAQACCAT